jgi:hypothetical protein
MPISSNYAERAAGYKYPDTINGLYAELKRIRNEMQNNCFVSDWISYYDNKEKAENITGKIRKLNEETLFMKGKFFWANEVHLHSMAYCFFRDIFRMLNPFKRKPLDRITKSL